MYIMDSGKSEESFDDYQAMLEESVGCETIVVDNNRW
jgi:hypothetical protein